MNEKTPTTLPEPDPPKQKRKRSTKAELLQRVEEVVLIRLSGAGFHDLAEYAREKGWGVQQAQLYEYMQQADARIKESLDKDRANLLDLHVVRRRTLFARCIEGGDWRAALAVLDSEAKLLGIVAPTQHQLTGKDGKALEMVVKQIGGGASMEDL
jgi:hypothetical protein